MSTFVGFTFFAKAAQAASCSCVKPLILPIVVTASSNASLEIEAMFSVVSPTKEEPIAIRSSPVLEEKSGKE